MANQGYSGNAGVNPGVIEPYVASKTNKPKGANGSVVKSDTKYL